MRVNVNVKVEEGEDVKMFVVVVELWSIKSYLRQSGLQTPDLSLGRGCLQKRFDCILPTNHHGVIMGSKD